MPAAKQNAVLVFGENDNDRSALVEIAKALAPDATVRYEKRHKPLILVSNQERSETIRSTVSDIKKLVRAAKIRFNVLAIIAHRDCDAVEPAHIELSKSIKMALKDVGVEHVIAATPAFELEAWWLLFPEAVQSVCSSWEKFNYAGNNVGMIFNAKEHLRQLVRPKDPKKRTRCPEYSESDSVRIARKVRDLGLIRRPTAHQCASLFDFAQCVDAIFTPKGQAQQVP